MRRVVAALAALLISAPAWGTTYNVTNDTNLATAMAAAVAGDVVNLAAASYTGSFVPANSGTAGNYIRIVGSQASPTTVSTTQGLTWAEGVAQKSYISWTGIKVNDDVTWFRANYCSLTYARVDSGGLKLYRANTDVTSDGTSQGNVISDCTFRQNVNSEFAVLLRGACDNRVSRCRFYGTATNAITEVGRGRYLYRSQNNTFTDCGLFMEAWGAENGEQYTQGIRDSSTGNVFLRDTIWAGLTSKRSRRVLLSQSGTYPGTTGNNSWVSCDYRSWHESATDISFEFQDHTSGVVQNTVFASRMGTALQLCSPTTSGLQIRHCTFYSGGKQVINSSDTVLPTSTTHLKGCAFIARGTGDCASNTTQLFFLQTLGAFGQSDSNYFATADTTNTFRKSGGGAVCYTPGAWRTATSNDLASRSYVLAAGAVTDTTWATLDLRPASSSSSLKSAAAPSGYYGAFDITTVTISQFAAYVKDETAGLELYLSGDTDTTATVVGGYGAAYSDTMATWVRLPGQSRWYTSLFGLTPGASYDLRVTATKSGTPVMFDTTITARAASWWTSTGRGPENIYVSTTGDDYSTGDGTVAKPYRTINRAWYVLTNLKPNRGRGGTIWLRGGTYYSTGYISGGYATPDSMYTIRNYPGELPIISGLDETKTTAASLTWTQVGSTDVWRTYYASASSLGGMWWYTNDVPTALLHKATTYTELHNNAGTTPASWTSSSSWYTNGTDSVYVNIPRTDLTSPYESFRLLTRNKLLAIYTPYVRVVGLSFQFAGGANGFALQIGTGGGSYRANGSAVDSCTFADGSGPAIYSHSGSELNGDSVVVSRCVMNITQSQAAGMGYNATKDHAEETLSGLSIGGSNWLITNNTFTGFVNAVAIGERLNSDSLSISSNNVDFRDNIVANTADDGVELDYSQGHNLKVYRNSFETTARAISMAPCYDGPLYVLYNRVRNPGWEVGQGGYAFKFGTGAAGHSRAWGLIANNTVWTDSTLEAGSVGEAGSFQNKHFRNNVFVGKTSWLPVRNTGSADCNVNNTDFNYNLIWTWGAGSNVAIWQGTNRTLATWRSVVGFDANGINANPQFTNLSSTGLAARGGADLGMRITGISGKIIPLVGAPDIGASELSADGISETDFGCTCPR